jgi:hypothetical protein
MTAQQPIIQRSLLGNGSKCRAPNSTTVEWSAMVRSNVVEDNGLCIVLVCEVQSLVVSAKESSKSNYQSKRCVQTRHASDNIYYEYLTTLLVAKCVQRRNVRVDNELNRMWM